MVGSGSGQAGAGFRRPRSVMPLAARQAAAYRQRAAGFGEGRRACREGDTRSKQSRSGEELGDEFHVNSPEIYCDCSACVLLRGGGGIGLLENGVCECVRSFPGKSLTMGGAIGNCAGRTAAAQLRSQAAGDAWQSSAGLSQQSRHCTPTGKAPPWAARALGSGARITASSVTIRSEYRLIPTCSAQKRSWLHTLAKNSNLNPAASRDSARPAAAALRGRASFSTRRRRTCLPRPWSGRYGSCRGSC